MKRALARASGFNGLRSLPRLKIIRLSRLFGVAVAGLVTAAAAMYGTRAPTADAAITNTFNALFENRTAGLDMARTLAKSDRADLQLASLTTEYDNSLAMPKAVSTVTFMPAAPIPVVTAAPLPPVAVKKAPVKIDYMALPKELRNQIRLPMQILAFNAIGDATQKIGVETAPVLRVAMAESNLKTLKAPTSTADGPFQIINQTWLELIYTFGPKHGYDYSHAVFKNAEGKFYIAQEKLAKDYMAKGHKKKDAWKLAAKEAQFIMRLRRDVNAAALLATESLNRSEARLKEAFPNRKVTGADKYAMWFLGDGGGMALIRLLERKPGASAAAAFPKPAAANHNVFYDRRGHARSVKSMYALLAKKVSFGGSRLDKLFEQQAIEVAENNATERLSPPASIDVAALPASAPVTTDAKLSEIFAHKTHGHAVVHAVKKRHGGFRAVYSANKHGHHHARGKHHKRVATAAPAHDRHSINH